MRLRTFLSMRNIANSRGSVAILEMPRQARNGRVERGHAVVLRNGAMQAVRKYFEFVRFSHTVFAMPFALAAMWVAGWPGWRTFGLILAAMVCARTAAMGFNRIADRNFDALNPRTQQRHLPAGKISLPTAWLMTGASAAGL